MAAGYFACYLSRPKPVTSFDLASTYVPRHLRRNTKGMRRNQRKMERDRSQVCRTKNKRKPAKSTFRKHQATTQRTPISFLSPSEEVSQIVSTMNFKKKPRRKKFTKGQKSKQSRRISRAARMKYKENLVGSRLDMDHERCAYKERCFRRQIYNDHLVNMIGPKELLVCRNIWL